MAIDFQKNKETPKIHEEIIELEKILAKKRQELAEKKEIKHEKEIIKEILQERLEQPAAPKIKPVVIPALTIKKIQGKPKEKQIQLLTNLAFEKGVIYATEMAKGLNDPYILDEFHDTLVDELYDYLVKQGKLKQI